MSEQPQPEPQPETQPEIQPETRDAEQEQSELDLGVISTGSGPVDQALKPLEKLGAQPVSEHPAVFEQVLTDLSATMSDGTTGTTSGDTAEPSADEPDFS